MTVRSQQVHAPATLPSKKDLWWFWLVQDCVGFEVKPARRRGRSLCVLVILTAIRQLCIDFLYDPLVLSVGNVLRFSKMLKPVTLQLHLLSFCIVCIQWNVHVIHEERSRSLWETLKSTGRLPKPEPRTLQFCSVPNPGTRNVEQVSLTSRTNVTLGPESVACGFLSLDPSVDGCLASVPILLWH